MTSLITSNYSGFNVSSPTACDGAALSTPTNGVAPYTFLWSNGGTSASNSSLCAGSYSLTVTDVNGCTSTSSGTLTSPEGVFPTVTQTSNFNGFGVSCDDKCDGHSRLTIVGGALPYSVKWSTGKIDIINTVNGFSDVFNLCAGTYTVTVSDDNDVTSIGTVEITTPGPFYLDLNQTRPTTLSACDGLILANALNGVAPVTYTYSVAGSSVLGTGPKIDDLCVDRKIVFFATDANGCTATARDTVGYPSDGCFQVDPVITPGTQDGKNDLLTITCIESANSSSLQIFNRWGQLVYTAEGYTNFSSTSWDGNNSKKQLLPEGVYYYVLNFTDEENTNFQQKGYIHLIR
jgi:gliding motility-associated-like protein